MALVLVALVGTIAYRWIRTGAHPVPTSVAVERFQAGNRGKGDGRGPGPVPGVYRYQGSGTETISVPPKSQSEGPDIPGTVTDQPHGCFGFRLDYSDVHWQRWSYCVERGGLVTTSKAGYYLWNFVVMSVDDTSTYTCRPAAVTIPSIMVLGVHHPVSCSGRNNHLSTGPVQMTGTSTVVATSTLQVGGARQAAVLVREIVHFSGGQHGSNDADTWFSVGTGLPLRGTWSTEVATPSPVGTSTLRAHGEFSLLSPTPRQ